MGDTSPKLMDHDRNSQNYSNIPTKTENQWIAILEYETLVNPTFDHGESGNAVFLF